MPSREKLSEFVAWCGKHITGDETFRSGTLAQIFLDHLLQTCAPP
jgi:CYTH domain-containing protein